MKWLLYIPIMFIELFQDIFGKDYETEEDKDYKDTYYDKMDK